ncbi:MAG: MFS transporter [Propionibacteriaceae bacterium]|nr:MFS transporter [Propionibacteriaceae bacterium]
MKNPLIRTLVGLRGNPRACVYTEPLWGLSMNLCLPYMSVYMLANGLHDAQIGLVSTAGMLAQVVFGLLGGVITDKLGRRKTTPIFDLTAWSIPCLIWFAASHVDQTTAFWLFVGASVVNGAAPVTQNAWDCLLAEDAEREQIPHVYSLIMVAGNLSALFAPIAAALVAQYSLVPAVRILLLNACVVMTVKLVWLYLWSHETERGLVRLAQTRGKSMVSLLAGYGGVLRIIARSPGTVFALAIAALAGAIGTVNQLFWPVIVTQKLDVPEAALPFFPMVRSLLAILFYFTVIHKVTGTSRFRVPLVAGFGAYLVGQGLVAAIPAGSAFTYTLLGVCLLFDSFGLGMLAMLAEAIVALHVDQAERSRVMAVQRTAIMLAISPLGWISGLLSGIDRSLPFVLTAGLAMFGAGLTLWYYRIRRRSTSLG